MGALSLTIYQLHQRKKAMLLQMESWDTTMSCRMEENGPWHQPISDKMHTQPCLSIRNSDYTQAFAQIMRNGASYLSKRSPATTTATPTECQGTTPPPFVGAPSEKRKLDKRGLVIGLATLTVAAPFTRVQYLMQNQNAIIQSGRLSQPYKGIFNCFATTIRNEGFLSLWRGNTAKILESYSRKVMSFVALSYVESRNGTLDTGGLLGYGGLLVAATLIRYPLAYAGTRLATDIKTTANIGSERQFNGIVDVLRKTLKSDGIPGLYRGLQFELIAFVMRLSFLNRLSAALKPQQLLGSFGLQNNGLASTLVLLGYGYCTKMAIYPMDTMRSRMMMTSGEAIKYKNAADIVSKILKNEGLKPFYHGGCSALLGLAAPQLFFMFLLYLLKVDVNKITIKESDDGGNPTYKLTTRWRKEDNGEN